MSHHFPTTNWTALVGRDKADDVARQAALEYVAAAYWEPIYAFVRRRGYDPERALDLTQTFFLGLLDGRLIDQADPERGRFRAFLATALRNFLINEHERVSARRRSPEGPLLSLDTLAAEQRVQIDAVDGLTPEQVFERRWAQSLIRRALEHLEQEQARTGHGERFRRLRRHVIGEGETSYAQLTRELELSEAALKKVVSRLRKRFGELLRAEVAATVVDAEDVDSELRHLLETAVF